MLQERRASWILLIVACAAVLLVPQVIQSGYMTHIMTMIALSAYLGTSWNIMSGYSGQMSLGHGVFLGVGAYASMLLYTRLGINPWIAMILAALICAALGGAIGYALFRLRAAFFTLSTMALLKVVTLLTIYFRSLTNGNMGITVPLNKQGFLYLNFANKIGYFYVTVGLLAVAIVVAYKLQGSRLGLSLFALRDDHDAAESLGVDTHLSKVTAMALSAFLASMGGSVFAHYTLYIDPGSIFNAKFSVEMALVSMLGGLGTIWGPTLGAALTVPIDALLRSSLGGGQLVGLNLIVYGLLLITVVQFFPQGIIPKIRARLRARKNGGAGASTDPIRQQVPRQYSAAHRSHQPPRDSGDKILQVSDLAVRFGGLTAVSNLSFHVNRGEIFGLIGPNGAGKTTVFNAVSGYVQPTGGKILFCDSPVKRSVRPHRLCRRGLVRTFQAVRPFSRLTLADNVMVGSLLHSANHGEAEARARRALDMVGLLDRRDDLPGNLTVADQKRLDLARTLAVGPEMLMLDEPMAGLTPNEVDDMVGLIRRLAESGISIVIIEHVMKAVMSLCDRVVVLDHGEKIAEGTPSEVAGNSRVIDVYLGEEHDV